MHKIPNTWKILPMSSIGEVIGGRQKTPHKIENATNRPYLRVANVQDGWIDYSHVKEMPFTDDQVKTYALKHYDILLAEGQSLELVGRPAVYFGKAHECCFQNTLIRLRTKSNDPTFVFHLCWHLYSTKVFQRIAKKTTSIAHLGLSRFAELKAPLPPLPEQKKIAKILSTWDRAIKTQQDLVDAKTDQKRSLMQRFTSHRNNPKWTFIAAKEIFENRSERNANNEPILSAAQDRGIVLRSDLKRKIQAEQSNESNYKLVYPGDFVISLRSFQGGLEFSKLKGAVSPAYHIIQPHVEINRDYYRHYFKSREFIERLSVAVIGIRDGKQIAFRDFSFLKLPYPPIGEQHTIAKVLNVAEKELMLLTEQLRTLREQKRGLMQSLLTGNLRVKT